MNKPAKPLTPLDDASETSMSDKDVDAWIDRNREALKVLVDEAWEQVERGEFDNRSFAEVMAEGRQKLRDGR